MVDPHSTFRLFHRKLKDELKTKSSTFFGPDSEVSNGENQMPMASMSKHDLNTNNEDMMQKPKFQDQYFSVTAKNIKEATAQETMAMNQNNEIM